MESSWSLDKKWCFLCSEKRPSLWERNCSTNHVDVVTLLNVNGTDNLPFRSCCLYTMCRFALVLNGFSLVGKRILRTTIGFSWNDFAEFSEPRQNPKMVWWPKEKDTFPAVVINSTFLLQPASWCPLELTLFNRYLSRTGIFLTIHRGMYLLPEMGYPGSFRENFNSVFSIFIRLI